MIGNLPAQGSAGLGRHFVFDQGNTLVRGDGRVLHTFSNFPYNRGPYGFTSAGQHSENVRVHGGGDRTQWVLPVHLTSKTGGSDARAR